MTVRKLTQRDPRLKDSHQCLNICSVAGGKQSTPGSTLGLTLFSIFTDDLDDDIECKPRNLKRRLIRVESLTCQILTVVDGSSGTWDLASRKPIKFNKMCKVPRLGRNAATCQGRLGTVWLSGSPPGEDLEVTADVRSNVSQQHAHCNWGKLHIGLLLKGGQQIEETHYPCPPGTRGRAETGREGSRGLPGWSGT